jgi:hypothetical protein
MSTTAIAKFHRLQERRLQLTASLRDVSDRWHVAHGKMREAKAGLITGYVDPVENRRYREREHEELKVLTEKRQAAFDKAKVGADRLLAERDAVQQRVAVLNQIVENCSEELKRRNIRFDGIAGSHNAPVDHGPGVGIFR